VTTSRIVGSVDLAQFLSWVVCSGRCLTGDDAPGQQRLTELRGPTTRRILSHSKPDPHPLPINDLTMRPLLNKQVVINAVDDHSRISGLETLRYSLASASDLIAMGPIA
jgi:hypothetical protein